MEYGTGFSDAELATLPNGSPPGRPGADGPPARVDAPHGARRLVRARPGRRGPRGRADPVAHPHRRLGPAQGGHRPGPALPPSPAATATTSPPPTPPPSRRCSTCTTPPAPPRRPLMATPEERYGSVVEALLGDPGVTRSEARLRLVGPVGRRQGLRHAGQGRLVVASPRRRWTPWSRPARAATSSRPRPGEGVAVGPGDLTGGLAALAREAREFVASGGRERL